MAHYRVSRKAMRDLDAIWYSIAVDNESAADRHIDSLYDAIATLTAQSRLGRERSALMPGMRGLVVNVYEILYVLTKTGVRIVRIWDCRQNPQRLSRELLH